MVPIGSIVADHERHVVASGFASGASHAERGGFQIQRVLRRLEQQRIDAAAEPGGLDLVGGGDLVERHVAA